MDYKGKIRKLLALAKSPERRKREALPAHPAQRTRFEVCKGDYQKWKK